VRGCGRELRDWSRRQGLGCSEQRATGSDPRGLLNGGSDVVRRWCVSTNGRETERTRAHAPAAAAATAGDAPRLRPCRCQPARPSTDKRKFAAVYKTQFAAADSIRPSTPADRRSTYARRPPCSTVGASSSGRLPKPCVYGRPKPNRAERMSKGRRRVPRHAVYNLRSFRTVRARILKTTTTTNPREPSTTGGNA